MKVWYLQNNFNEFAERKVSIVYKTLGPSKCM